MNVEEIIAKVDESIQDGSLSPGLSDINNAVAFIASQSFLPSLVTKSVVSFLSTDKSITGATNASPIVLTFDSAHGFSTGDIVIIIDVAGNSAANGTWYIEVLSDTTCSLLKSTGNGDYIISGGMATLRNVCAVMPANYDHDLFEATSLTDETKLTVRMNVKALGALNTELPKYMNGTLKDVAVENGMLYGSPPQIDNIVLCTYYKKPDVLALVTDIPSCIPLHLHEELLVSYILTKKWSLKEDGTDGKSPNMDRAIKIFSSGMSALSRYYPRPSVQTPEIQRKIIFF